MLYSPHPKQKEVHDSKARYKVLNWGRRCFATGTLVRTEHGYTAIEKIGIGDKVLSYNQSTNTPEFKTVLQNHAFGVDYSPKPMITLTIDDETGYRKITSTYDHEFYSDGLFVPVYQLIWGILDSHQRAQLKLLCKQYGTPFDNQLEEQEINQSNETSKRRFWVFENGIRRQNDKGTQDSSSNIPGESRIKTASESQKRDKDRQQTRKSGVGNSQGEYSTYGREQSPGDEPRGEVRNSQTNRKRGAGNIGIPEEESSNEETDHSKEIIHTLWHSDRQHTGHFEGKELEVSSVTISEVQTTHDLTVEDNHNYVVEDLLVHNTGKSTLAVNYTIWEALQAYRRKVEAKEEIRSPLNYFIVAPTYRQAKSIYWNDIIKATVPREIVADYNESELSITIPHFNPEVNGETLEPIVHPNAESLPAIVISLKGSDNEDSLRGVKLAGAVLDEYAYMKPAVWQKIIRPALSDERGWALFISTPNGFNHFYEIAETAQGFVLDSKGNWKQEYKDGRPNWFYSKATIYDNPHISREEIEEVKEDELSKDSDGTTWHQEYLAEFKQMAGLVYKEFDRKLHLVKPDQIPEEGTRLIGIDFGYENPFAAVFVLIDYDQNWWVYDLIYQRRMTTVEAVNRLKDKMTGQYFTTIVGDPGGPGKQEIENFKTHSFPIRPAFKGGGGQGGSIKAGIRLVAEKLRLQPQVDGTMRPKLFIREDLKPLIIEFETYHYPIDEAGTMVQRDLPVKENDHALDALRYLFLSRTEHRKTYQKREKKWDPITGRSLN